MGVFCEFKGWSNSYSWRYSILNICYNESCYKGSLLYLSPMQCSNDLLLFILVHVVMQYIPCALVRPATVVFLWVAGSTSVSSDSSRRPTYPPLWLVWAEPTFHLCSWRRPGSASSWSHPPGHSTTRDTGSSGHQRLSPNWRRTGVPNCPRRIPSCKEHKDFHIARQNDRHCAGHIFRRIFRSATNIIVDIPRRFSVFLVSNRHNIP